MSKRRWMAGFMAAALLTTTVLPHGMAVNADNIETTQSDVLAKLNESRELWLNFDNEDVKDYSGNALATQAVGTLTYETGHDGSGKALTLSSAGKNYVNLGKSGDIQSEQITFSAWVKAPTGGFSGEQVLLWCKPAAQWYGAGYYISLNHSGALYFNVGAGTNGDGGAGMFQAYCGADVNTFFPADTWVHIAVTFDSDTNEVAFYRNGAKMAHTILDGTTQTIAQDTTKDKYLAASGYGNGMEGAVDEVAIYSAVATAEEVQAMAGIDVDKMLQEDADALYVPANVSEDFTLTTAGNYGTTISWTSEHSAIAVSGSQAVVTRGDEDVTGKLVATISYGEETEKRTFEVTVKAYSENTAEAVSFTRVNITDKFWSARQKQVICSILNVGIEKVEATNGGFNNFIEATKKNNGETAKAFEGDVYFLDSDTYKMIEAMSYALQVDANGDEEILAAQEEILAKLDYWIPYIVGAQEDDGYLDTFFTLDRGSQSMSATTAETEKWTDFAAHEMYVAGHFYEAAVALYRANGDTRLLDAAIKNADLVNRLFGEGAGNQASGHQEIEVGLLKLAAACTEAEADGADGAYASQYGEKSAVYVKLARRLLDARGNQEDRVGYFSFLPNDAQYRQDHEAVADQTEGVGHVVRAMYQYMAMTDVALLEDTYVYDNALTSLWEDITETKTYVTGGMGVEGNNESFGASYELPNDGSYSETCGSIASVMWNQRMNLFYGDAKYADEMEHTLYNAVLDGVNFDGDKFFYQNPISSDGDSNRSAWFGCACCPPNLMRLINSLGSYIYTQADDQITVNMYIGNTVDLDINGNEVKLELESEMPWEGNASLTVTQADNQSFSLRLRVPEWATGENKITVNGVAVDMTDRDGDGYVVIDRIWNTGDTISIEFPMSVERVYTDENATENTGNVAIQRGPVVYAAESADNDFKLDLFTLPEDAEFTATYTENMVGGEDTYGVKDGVVLTATGTLDTINGKVSQDITLIPYYAWNNRGSGSMRVFLNESNENEYSAEDYAKVSASYTSIWQSLASINDKDDTSFWCSWIEGSVKINPWVMYEFDTEVTVEGCSVNWMADNAGVRVPSGITIEYWTGTEWKEVTATHAYDTFKASQYNDYLFDAVETTKIRMTMQNTTIGNVTYALGVYEWKLKLAEEDDNTLEEETTTVGKTEGGETDSDEESSVAGNDSEAESSAGSDSNEESSAAGNDTTDGSSTVNTGDSAPVAVFSLLLLAAVTAVLFTRKSKLKNTK